METGRQQMRRLVFGSCHLILPLVWHHVPRFVSSRDGAKPRRGLNTSDRGEQSYVVRTPLCTNQTSVTKYHLLFISAVLLYAFLREFKSSV